MHQLLVITACVLMVATQIILTNSAPVEELIPGYENTNKRNVVWYRPVARRSFMSSSSSSSSASSSASSASSSGGGAFGGGFGGQVYPVPVIIGGPWFGMGPMGMGGGAGASAAAAASAGRRRRDVGGEGED